MDQYTHEVFKCTKPNCNFICYTVNQLQEHMLDRHSTLVTPTYTSNGQYKGSTHGQTLHKEGIQNEPT